MAKSGIYAIENILNGHRYVGSSVDIHDRWRKHLWDLGLGKHHSRPLQAAFRKHGRAAFHLTVLFICDRENLVLFEQRAIDIYRPYYNVSPTAGSKAGMRCSAETIKKMALAQRGKKRSPETKLKIGMASKGRVPTYQTRLKISEAGRGRHHSDQHRQRISIGLMGNQNALGRQWSSSERAHLSAAAKGHHNCSPETIAKLSQSHRGKPWSESQRAARAGKGWSPARRAAYERWREARRP